MRSDECFKYRKPEFIAWSCVKGIMSGKTKARGLGGGVMTGITSAARSAEIAGG